MQQHRPVAAPDYEADFFSWTRHQAKLLRVLGELPVGLPEGLDIPHIAEEIEDLGGAKLNAAKSFIRQILIHLIKAASEPKAEAFLHWRAETRAFSVELKDTFLPSMRRSIDMQELWEDALGIAEARLQANGGDLAPDLPQRCPFALDEIVLRAFNFDVAFEKLLAASARA